MPCRRLFSALVLVLTGVTARAAVEADLAFLPAERSERLDLYLPAGRADDARFPVVVFVHGGGWVKGDKADRRSRNIAKVLTGRGYAVASINYRLAPEGQGTYLGNCAAAFPQNVQDVKSAVRFLRAHAEDYGLDPDRIALMGASAGAHLAVLAAVTGPADGLEPSGDGHGDVSSAVRAAIGLYGVYDWRTFNNARPSLAAPEPGGPFHDEEAMVAVAERASPVVHLDPEDPPIYAIHGTRDKHVHPDQTRQLGAKLVELGRPETCTRIVEGAPHSFDFRLKRFDLASDVLPFLAAQLGAGTGTESSK